MPESNSKSSRVDWWMMYSDATLNTLVNQGLQQNLDILQTIERINIATANVTAAAAGGLPSLTASESLTGSGENGKLRSQLQTRETLTPNLTASWLLDLFGQYRNARKSAVASLDAAYATVEVSKLTLLQDLISSYIDARYYQQRLALSKIDLESRRRTLDLTKVLLSNQSATLLDVARAQDLVVAMQAEIPSFEIGFRSASHRLSTLLGQPAPALDALLSPFEHQPAFSGDVDTGVPADLIRKRPDIRKAEQDLLAATAEIGVAKSQLYPSITLSGSITPTLIKQGGIQGMLGTWSFGPSLNLPIFDGGRIKANIDTQESTARVQYLVWKSVVLQAVEQVENSLVAVRNDRQIVAALKLQVSNAKRISDLSLESYKNGDSSLLDVLDAQRTMSDAEANLAASVQQLAKDFVVLNVAVGSGYAPDTPSNVASTNAAK